MENNKKIIIIPGKALYINRVYYIDSSNTCPHNPEALIVGQVKYPDGRLAIGAGVEIIEIGYFRKSIACTFTDSEGEYEICFKYKPYLNYELNIYDIASNN